MGIVFFGLLIIWVLLVGICSGILLAVVRKRSNYTLFFGVYIVTFIAPFLFYYVQYNMAEEALRELCESGSGFILKTIKPEGSIFIENKLQSSSYTAWKLAAMESTKAIYVDDGRKKTPPFSWPGMKKLLILDTSDRRCEMFNKWREGQSRFSSELEFLGGRCVAAIPADISEISNVDRIYRYSRNMENVLSRYGRNYYKKEEIVEDIKSETKISQYIQYGYFEPKTNIPFNIIFRRGNNCSSLKGGFDRNRFEKMFF